MELRQVTPEDAPALIELTEQLYAESTYLLYDPGEATPAVEAYARRIADTTKNESWVMFVAQEQGRLIGAAGGNRGHARRTRHSLLVFLGVVKTSWGQGVGRALLKAIEAWARAKGIHRLELTVQPGNARALALYESQGFEREGLKRHALKISGQYADEWFMSKLLI